MPLRMRLIALIGLLLLVSVLCGSALIAWHAANSVRIELRAALNVGANAARNAIEEMSHAGDRAGAPPDQGALPNDNALRHLISTFNGNRHVRATLTDARDQPVAVSELFVPAQPAPGWFVRWIGDEPGAVRLPVPGGRFPVPGGHLPVPEGGDGAIILRSDPLNEIAEVWSEARDSVLVLAGFAALSALLISAVVGRALRPLENLSDAFDRIGKGDYHGQVPEQGPPELQRLAGGFNLMTRRLATAAAQNRRLNERLLTLQAEERADLARDLHDEIGPLLFAVDMTAAAIDRLASGDRGAEIAGQARSIQEAIGQMQRHVRMLLGRLRPAEAAGLAVAIDRLAAFWRDRQPGITFDIDVSVEDDRLGDGLRSTIYRVVQEGMTNAIRHGKPRRVEIAVSHEDVAHGDVSQGDFAHGDVSHGDVSHGDSSHGDVSRGDVSHGAVSHGAGGRIRIEVTDDGAGMATNGGTAADGTPSRDPGQLGLVGMRERVMAMAGSLTIRHGRDGKGLALIVGLPCEQPAEQPE